ncbi:MAG: hypothetical protein GY816_16130 [Cytophagales bacterium]|nr:hypothetical protein [Cytophagales bacterium]
MKTTKNALKYLVLVPCVFISQNIMAQPLYFSTPQECVEIAAQLLIQEDWEILSKYYFLENSDEAIIDSLKNGSYFIRDKKPELIHPTASWRYKKPFDPNFSYSGHFEEDLDRIKVAVEMEIDQGNGMIQRGMSSFYLRRSENGYQLVP